MCLRHLLSAIIAVIVNASTPRGVKRFVRIIKNSPIDEVLGFIEKASPTVVSDHGWLLLQAAVSRGEVAIVEALRRAGASYPSTFGTLLSRAALRGDLALVTYFARQGDKVNATDSRGMTALMYAVRENRAPVVDWLLDHGADPDMRSIVGEDALTLARKTGSEEIIDRLMQERQQRQ
jgi:uncharacterized protein